MKSHDAIRVLSLLAAAACARNAAADPPPARTAEPVPPPPAAPGATPPTSSPPGSVPIEPENDRTRPERPRFRPPPPEERPPPGRVAFVPNDPSVTLLTMNGVAPVRYPVYYGYGWGFYHRHFVYGGYAPVYTPICRGPCDASMEPGTYELALEKNGRVVRAGPTYIPGSAELRGTYVDRSGARTAGVVVLVVGSIAGLVMTVASFERHETCDVDVCFDRDTVNGPLFAAGIGVLVGSIVTGSILASLHDKAFITVRPLHVSSVRGMPGVAFDRAVTEGAALSLRF